MPEKKEIVIIGGGPGGYLAALRSAQLGRKVTLVERDRVGGTCMNYGCIPTKYLLHQTKIYKEMKSCSNISGPRAELTLDWAGVQAGRRKVVDRLVSGVSFLLGKGKVEVIKGTARLGAGLTVIVRTADGETVLEAEKIIIASGSRAAGLPFITPDGRDVVTSTEALEFPEVPKSMIVIGAGAIGLEIGTVCQRAGCDVTVLEMMPTVMPGSDREAAARMERILKRQGLKIFTSMKIEKAERTADGAFTFSGTCTATGQPFSFQAEKVLIAAGRKPETEALFEDGPQLETVRGGFIKVDEYLETSRPGVYAIGDVIGGKLLAHKAYCDALTASENACGGTRRPVDYSALPAAVFTEPEFASVGLTAEEAEGRGIKARIGVFPLQASGRAMTMDATEGLVKIIADEDEKVIGAHVVSPGASDMIPVLTMAVARGMKLEDVASIIYIHPTLSESIGEAALKARNEALHILNS